MATLQKVWADDIDLREAEDFDLIGTEVSTINVAAGTETLDVVSFSPADFSEILAVLLELEVSLTHDAEDIELPRAMRQRTRLAYQVTYEDDFAGAGERTGDFFAETFHIRTDIAYADEAAGAAAGHPADVLRYRTLFDPGKDSESVPLVMSPNDELRVHKFIGDPGIAADEELLENIRLGVWFEQVPRAEFTRVREEFPSTEQSGDMTI